MTTYLALLRGINLGGRNKVAMADLRKLFVDLGHGDAKTYIQTGNVIFCSPSNEAPRLSKAIETRIAEDLGVPASVLLRTKNDIAHVIANGPFLGRTSDPAKLLVTFLAEEPDPARVTRLDKPAGETAEFEIAGREVYLHCPDGYGRTKLSNAYIERRLGVAATTRNWRVITKLSELMNE
jgi:uncharacterized protein (DUF1697 family)